MSAVYLLGCKEVETKKGKSIVASLLCKDGWGNPAVRAFWIPAESPVAEEVMLLPVGCPVIPQTVFGNDRTLCGISEDDNPAHPCIDLSGFWANN